MAKSKGKKKDELMERGVVLLSAIGGGIAANQGSNFVEKQGWLGEYGSHAPAIPAGLGALGFLFIPQKDMLTKAASAFCLGMAVVGGTEEAEIGIGAIKGSLGYTYENLGLGFVPQLTPGQFQNNVVYSDNGIPIR